MRPSSQSAFEDRPLTPAGDLYAERAARRAALLRVVVFVLAVGIAFVLAVGLGVVIGGLW